jgi:uncharacterized protein DUF5631/uncharacterized protein DUF5632
LAIPAFSSPVDCSAWVTGGLWPAELSTADAETGTLADYLRADLSRITATANDELKVIKRAGMPDPVRQAEEARVIDEARARAERRVESTVRHLHALKAKAPSGHPGPETNGAVIGRDVVAARAVAAVTREEPAVDPVVAAVAGPEVDEEGEPQGGQGRHRAADDATADEHTTARAPDASGAAVASEADDVRLRRLLAFVAHQEPRLNWAVGDRSDGTTVLVTDLAHGWIPPGITLPAGVRLLEPQRRVGKLSALIGETTRMVTYAPGDSLGRLDDFAETAASVQPRELPPVADPGWELSQATHWRDGLPRMVHTLARAAAAETGIAEEEIDLLRVHLDTARYQLFTQYPDVNPALLLNCLLLAATEGGVTGDPISANYHLAWFQKLSAPADNL